MTGAPEARVGTPGPTLRRVTLGDATTLFEWANDAVTRSQSFDPTPIAWGTHVAWLGRKLGDPLCQFYLAEVEGEAVATVRFDARDVEAEISVTVAPHARGRGLSSPSIAHGVRQLFDTTGVAAVRALIKPGNVASERAFVRAGFTRADSPRPDARCYVLLREP
jgi:RimJ/RimL family protein N-acetyltransferase